MSREWSPVYTLSVPRRPAPPPAPIRVVALVASYGPDKNGDVLMPGCWRAWLRTLPRSQALALPVYLDHRRAPQYQVGTVVNLVEGLEDLIATMEFPTSSVISVRAAQLAADGIGFSIGARDRLPSPAGGRRRIFSDLALEEISLTPTPAGTTKLLALSLPPR